jgi:hypothetical protein
MIKAHVTSVGVHGLLEADRRTGGDTVDAGIGTAATITTSTATPVDTTFRMAE